MSKHKEKKTFKEEEENKEKNNGETPIVCSNCFRPIDIKYFPSRKPVVNINLDLNLNLVVILVAILLLR